MSGYEGASPAALIHRLLLRLAGRFPDEVLAADRIALAAEPVGEVALAVTRHAIDHSVGLHADDVRLLSGLVSDEELHARLRRLIGPVGAAGEQFVPALPEQLAAGVELPPVLDLSLRTAEEIEGLVDDLDVAAMTAVASLPAIAFWRAWRLRRPGVRKRVFLVELDCPVDELPGYSAGLTTELRRAGDEAPQVEAYAVGSELPPYQTRARENSALLWAAEATEPVRVAQAFDHVDPERGPCFDDSHERLADPEREAVLRYFDEAPALLTTTETMVDFVEPERGSAVPVIHRTDGRWAWTDLAPYYLRTYGLAPDPGLLAHVRANNYEVPELGHIARQRVLAELFNPV